MEAFISIVGSILGSLAGKAAEYAVDPIARQVSYLFKHKSKFQKLKRQLQQLKDERERVQQTVNEAKRKGDEIFNDVDTWLTEVNGKICAEAAAQLEEDEGKANQRCFIGLCPNFKSRYQLSRKAEKEADIIAELLKKEAPFDRVSYRPAPEGIATRPVKDYVAFESRTGAFDAVMKLLNDANLSIIGVYGMGGVGKTTLVKQVAQKAMEEKMFDVVVMAVVTQDFDNKKIQDQIAAELGLKFDMQIDPARARELRGSLKKNNKVLIILDDIWKKLDMEDLGIPYGDEHRGCKILLTSRKVDVLNLMDSQENLPIGILKEEEAWELFKKMTTDIVLRPDLKSTAIEVAKKCAGLPIAIVTVGKSMKDKKEEFEWKNALQELRRPSKRNFEGIPGDVYSAIELSYKFLEVEEYRPTFLLCSIMGHDAAIEDLLKYGMGLRLFHGVDTIEETRYRVSTLVRNLKTWSLLHDGSTSDRFDMHDVVRDVALSIASRDHHWLALGRDRVFKDEEKMRNYELISLQYAEVSEFLNHDLLECPNLSFFSLGSENSSLKISNNFFKGMQSLKVLDFAKMHFSPLPSSFCFLKNIHTLCFSQCFLKDIAIIGELKNLEILSLRKSKIAVLPQEIGQLTKLTLLDLSYCSSLEVISPNVLSRLSRLEELYLYDSFDRWEVEGHEIFEKPSLVELQHLSHLTSLELHIPNEQAVPKELFSEKLERYKISIGEKWRLYDVLETSRNLKLKLNQSTLLYDIGVTTLLRKTETLSLDAVNLINLEAICYDQLKATDFGQLRIIKVQRCKMLKNLFSFSIGSRVDQLQEIEVSGCEKFTGLLVEKRGEDIGEDILEFSQLRSLKLWKLPSFIGSICSEKKVSSSQPGSSQSIGARSNATSLFDQKVLFPNIKELFLWSIPIEQLWHDQLPILSFGVQNLTSLELDSCHNLKNLFTSSMVKSFVQLKTLLVVDCDKIEEVIIITEGLVEEERMRKMVFPKLEYLVLRELPNLKRFCFGNPIEFPLLRILKIEGCPVLNTFHCDSTSVGTIVGNEAGKSSISMENLHMDVPKYLFNEKVALPMLEHLYIIGLENLEKLWPKQLDEDSFSKLISFQLYSCDKLLNAFPLSMLTRLQRLNELTVWSCNLLEEIFESQQEGSSSTAIQSISPELFQSSVVQENITFGFPQLTYLQLGNLPKLKSFFHKIHTTNWPSLKKLIVRRCDNVEIFASEYLSFPKTGGKNQQEIPIQWPLFWINELTFPNLQELTFDRNDGMKEILHGQSESVGGEEKPASASMVLSRLTELCLVDLEELMHLWKEKNGFQNLRILRVTRCPKLKSNLVPSSVCFQNLLTLEVQECPGIIKLVTHSTAKSLVKLREMKISACEKLEEIIEGSDGGHDEVKDEISFPQLNLLELTRLSKLESFCSSENHTFGFPSLTTVVVQDCQKMKMFSQGGLNTPMLHKVLLQSNKRGNQEHWIWEGSLNSTIQQLFKERDDSSSNVRG